MLALIAIARQLWRLCCSSVATSSMRSVTSSTQFPSAWTDLAALTGWHLSARYYLAAGVDRGGVLLLAACELSFTTTRFP